MKNIALSLIVSLITPFTFCQVHNSNQKKNGFRYENATICLETLVSNGLAFQGSGFVVRSRKSKYYLVSALHNFNKEEGKDIATKIPKYSTSYKWVRLYRGFLANRIGIIGLVDTVSHRLLYRVLVRDSTSALDLAVEELSNLPDSIVENAIGMDQFLVDSIFAIGLKLSVKGFSNKLKSFVSIPGIVSESGEIGNEPYFIGEFDAGFDFQGLSGSPIYSQYSMGNKLCGMIVGE